MTWGDWAAMVAAIVAAVFGELNRRKLGSVEKQTNGNLHEVKSELRSMRVQRDAVVAKVMEGPPISGVGVGMPPRASR